MDIKQVYREETELDVYAEHSLNYANYTNEYVKWLEAKINYTRCCETLPCNYSEGYNDAIAKIKEEAKYIDKQ